MSKLGSAPPPPPYKVPIAERLFGIGKLKPPVTEGVGQVGQTPDLLSTVRLGAFSLELDTAGQWQMDAQLEQMYRAQITQLEAKVGQLEDERLNKSVYELEKRTIALERERLMLTDENNQLKFKNKVLMAMCTISEVRRRRTGDTSGAGGGGRRCRCDWLACSRCVGGNPILTRVFRILLSPPLSLSSPSSSSFPSLLLAALATSLSLSTAQGDYKALCKEAGIEPRSQKKPVPSPATAAQQQQQQQQPLSSPMGQPSFQQPSSAYPAASPSNAAGGNPAYSPTQNQMGQRGPGGVPMMSPGGQYAAQSPYPQSQAQLQPQPYSTTNQQANMQQQQQQMAVR